MKSPAESARTWKGNDYQAVYWDDAEKFGAGELKHDVKHPLNYATLKQALCYLIVLVEQ
jgi:hypothetical protein